MRPNEYEPAEDELGPVDFLAVEFPDGRIGAADLGELLPLVSQGTIRILDAEFIVKDAAGNARKADAAELGAPDGTGIGAWSGASSGLLDDADVEHISAAIRPGAAAAVIGLREPLDPPPGRQLAAQRRPADRGRRDSGR